MMTVTEQVHISNVHPGDAVIGADGAVRTVGRKDIKDGFMGRTLFGDSYRLGTRLVTVQLFPVYRKGQLIAHVRQP